MCVCNGQTSLLLLRAYMFIAQFNLVSVEFVCGGVCVCVWIMVIFIYHCFVDLTITLLVDFD